MPQPNLFVSILLLFACSKISFGQVDLSVPFSNFTYHSKECFAFVYHSGSLVVVPEDAFTTEDGNICEGGVTIRYREIQTPSQMIGNNLNMATLDSKGKKRLLESAGMFEIEATCVASNQVLKLKKGKKIEVYFKSQNPINNVVLWKYSYPKKLWARKPQPITPLAANQVANDAKDWGGDRVPVDRGGFIDNESEGYYLSPEEYKKYLAEQKEIQKRDSIRKEVFKAVQIDEMGLYNCDRLISDEESVKIIAQFNIQTDSKVDKLYVVYRNLNSVIYYDFKPGQSLELQFWTDYQMDIIAIDHMGVVFQAQQKQLNKSYLKNKANQSVLFELENRGKINSTKQLALATGLN